MNDSTQHLDAAVQAYSSMGLAVGERTAVSQIHAAGMAINAARSDVLLRKIGRRGARRGGERAEVIWQRLVQSPRLNQSGGSS